MTKQMLTNMPVMNALPFGPTCHLPSSNISQSKDHFFFFLLERKFVETLSGPDYNNCSYNKVH